MLRGLRSGVVGTAAVVLLVLLAAAPAVAQEAEPTSEVSPTEHDAADARDEEARQLFGAGRIAFADGRFADALAYFERAYELSARPELLFNIGSAADRLRRNGVALEAFEAYLEARPDASNRREVEGRIRVLRETRVATPEQVAATAAEPEPTSEVDTALASRGAEEEDGSVFSTWWFWTGVGVVVVAAGVVTAVALSGGGGRSDEDGLVLGDDGVVHFTLLGGGP